MVNGVKKLKEDKRMEIDWGSILDVWSENIFLKRGHFSKGLKEMEQPCKYSI